MGNTCSSHRDMQHSQPSHPSQPLPPSKDGGLDGIRTTIPVKSEINEKIEIALLKFLEDYTVIDDDGYIPAPVLCALFARFIDKHYNDQFGVSINASDSYIKKFVMYSDKYKTFTVGYQESNMSMTNSSSLLFVGRRLVNIKNLH